MEHIAIYTDSACDLDLDYLKELNVKMVPLTVTIGEDEYRDRVTITMKDFYKKIKDGSVMPKTSQVTPEAFINEFKEGLKEYDRIIYIAFSSKLSGTYQSACIALEMLDRDRIDVVDTRAASVGLGLIVRKAALMAKEGKDRDEILNAVNDLSSRMEHVFVVGNLDMLKRGGRISKAAAICGTLLNIRPILHFIDGAIFPLDKVRGDRALIKRFLEVIEEKGKDIENQEIFGISYSGNDELAQLIKKEIEKKFKIKNFFISEIGAAIGSHVGEGTAAFFFLK